MNKAQILQFFKDIDATQVAKHETSRTYLGGGGRVYEYEEDGATQWVTRARTALGSLLPRTHPIVVQFEEILKNGGFDSEHTFERARSTFRAAKQMLENGQLVSMIEGIRAETESELLDQAQQLVRQGHGVAAAVLAGGALETHLHGLCMKHGLTWNGDGSISKYDGAIAQARNGGQEIYSATDTKSVQSWGGMRNDAAHTPTTFTASAERVLLMIDSIREFIARTT